MIFLQPDLTRGRWRLTRPTITDHGASIDNGELCNVVRIHQCDDLLEDRFLIDADRVARHHLTNQAGTRAPASRRVFFDAKQFFQPVSTR
jgi:hypothetical protein